MGGIIAAGSAKLGVLAPKLFLFRGVTPKLPLTSTLPAMSTASKATLALTTLGALSIVIAVHYGQKAERAVRTPGSFLSKLFF